ncbi:5-oxoprolinase subunit C family protein [Pontibacter fetidus]|uniref:Biotin-dependent carboxyltransferase family protein n=1 Tax=Pontibacter fetidus TaxID=2700082 RepID=A0A6B2H4S2_9BACT|nr:biotin-dependent carboxyltransferase family protein [Pontibacter fetidus]NDK57461.1 biotin-dependent carboxyltransferase family protein [Pontibacter fetidus]
MSIKILKPGLLSTIQDEGRYGYQKDGMVVSGAMDKIALRIANLLVGNAPHSAALEITLLGPQLYFDADHLIAVTGANLSPTIDGQPIKLWRPTLVKKGAILAFGTPVLGCRSYVAIAGGYAVPEVLGSFATYLRAGIGGYKGRALQADDILNVNEPDARLTTYWRELELPERTGNYNQATWSPAPELYPTYEENPTIRAVKGPEYELFAESDLTHFRTEKYLVKSESDRMGYRLQGSPLSLTEPKELLSSAVTFGTVQVPPQGQPIVLMADHQTTGGYPRVAQVITADLPKLAQVQPGKYITFEEVTLEKAQQLYMQQEQKLEQLEWALQIKMKL